jgi:putative addiction module killer protein
MMKLTLIAYVSNSGTQPFKLWLASLDATVRLRVESRLARFEFGNLGDHKAIGWDLWEARLAFGPGYRIYFGKDGEEVIVLLLGGDKASQRDDIRRGRQFWHDYIERKRHDATQ